MNFLILLDIKHCLVLVKINKEFTIDRQANYKNIVLNLELIQNQVDRQLHLVLNVHQLFQKFKL